MESRTQGSRPRTQKKIQGQGQPFRGQTLSRPRTGILETKAKDTSASALQKKKKKRSSQKNVFQKIFQELHKILTIQNILLSSSRGQANFRGLEASRPRPRTSKSVLEDSTSVLSLICWYILRLSKSILATMFKNCLIFNALLE